jgi:hypothetical protein
MNLAVEASVDPFTFTIGWLVVGAALYSLVQRDRTSAQDPLHIRRFGAAVAYDGVRVAEDAEVIGVFDGRPIHSRVVYLGMTYRFDRVMPPEYRHLVRPRELFVAPGLVYITD